MLSAIRNENTDPGRFDQVVRLLEDIQRPRLVGGEGDPIELPPEIFDVLCRVVPLLRDGRPVLIYLEDEEVTTQQAANILGVSRPMVVDLIKNNQIPHRMVGTHRRLKLSDVRKFMEERDNSRRQVLNELFRSIDEEGDFD